MGSVLGRTLHESHDDLPRLPGLARRGPLQRRRVDAARRQPIQNEVAHRGAAVANTNGAGARQRIILLGLHGSLKTLDRANLHAVLRRDLCRGCASAQESLNVARSKRGTSGRQLHSRTITARRAAELIGNQHRIAFTLGIGEHQGLAIGAGPEQFELNHHFLLKRLGRIVSNNAQNVA